MTYLRSADSSRCLFLVAVELVFFFSFRFISPAGPLLHFFSGLKRNIVHLSVKNQNILHRCYTQHLEKYAVPRQAFLVNNCTHTHTHRYATWPVLLPMVIYKKKKKAKAINMKYPNWPTAIIYDGQRWLKRIKSKERN